MSAIPDLSTASLGEGLPGEDAAARWAELLEQVPGAADVKTEQVTGLPMLSIEPNHRALAVYGLNPAAVQETVATAVGGEVAGQFFEGDRRFDLVVRLPENLRQDPAALAAVRKPRPPPP